MNVYNPHYDPLVDKNPGCAVNYAPTYWVDSVTTLPKDDGAIKVDVEVDAVVIGSGFTGLSTAIFLAKYGIKPLVLEANQVAWGCTSRNGGQGQLSVGRLSRSQWLKKWGEQTAKALHNEVNEGFETFKLLIYNEGIDCQPQGNGHLYIAHKPSIMAKLIAESNINNKIFNYPTKILSKQDIVNNYVNEQGVSDGALFEPIGIGINPLKLAFGYMNLARQYGAKVHTSSPVISWQEKGGFNYLSTPGGTIKAKMVAVATGGYTSASLHPLVSHRYMPILSNSVVTRVLTDAEIKHCGFKTNLVLTDTRILRFYYRLLPDNRLQIGSRSSITGKDACNKKHYDLLMKSINTKFPALRNIDIDYSWWGWVDVSHDMMPRIVQPDANKNIFYSFGYGGNGVSFSAHAGKRMAELMVGNFDKNLYNLPIYSSELPKHLFTHFRRIGQRMAYVYYGAKDKWQ